MVARTARRVRACHEMPMCELSVNNTKTGQDQLLVSVSLGGGTLSFDGGFNQGQLIAGSLVGVLAGLPKLTDCSGDRRIEVLEEARTRYRRADEDWPIWPHNPPFHCQAVPYGIGPSKNKLLYSTSEGRLLNDVFVPQDWRSAVTVPLYKSKGERNEAWWGS